MFIIEISYNVLYVWHCMELYDKNICINGNCMIRSFGQHGCIKNSWHTSEMSKNICQKCYKTRKFSALHSIMERNGSPSDR